MTLKHGSTRREVLQRLGGMCAFSWAAQAADLPLNTTGLEHYGMTVPDSKKAAEFYGKIFDPQLFQEKDPPPRFYVKMGTGYFAFGGNQNSTPFIDHFCALTEGLGRKSRRTYSAHI